MKDSTLKTRINGFAREKDQDDQGNTIQLFPSHNEGRYARDSFTGICEACYLPACYTDSDYEEECTKAGITEPTVQYCPIAIMIIYGLNIPQTQDLTTIAFERNYKPEQVIKMAEPAAINQNVPARQRTLIKTTGGV